MTQPGVENEVGQLSEADFNRLAVLDTLEQVLREADSENGAVPPYLLGQLVSQIQVILEPPPFSQDDMARLEQANQQLQEQLRSYEGAKAASQQQHTPVNAGPKPAHLPSPSHTTLVAMDQGMQTLRQLNKQLEQDLRTTQADLQAAVERASKVERQTQEQLRTQQEQWQGQLQQERGKCAAAEAVAVEAQAQLASLSRELAHTQAALTESESSLQGCKRKLEFTEHELHNCSRQLASVQSQLQQTQTELADSRQQLAEASMSQQGQASRACLHTDGTAPAFHEPWTTWSAGGMEAAHIALLQVELQGLRESNKSLAQQLIDVELRSGQPQGFSAQQSILQSELDGLRHSNQQLQEQLLLTQHELVVLRDAEAGWRQEQAVLHQQVLEAGQKVHDAVTEQGAIERQVTLAVSEARLAKQQAAQMHASAEAGITQLVQEQGALAGELVEARKRLVSSSHELEREVNTWRQATSQAVVVAEAAQAQVQVLEAQVAEVSAQLRAKGCEGEAREVEVLEVRKQLQQAQEWLNKRTELLSLVDTAVLKPLLSWYQQHGYPLLVRAPLQPATHHQPNHPPLHLHHSASAAALQQSKAKGPLGAGPGRATRPGGKPWPEPVAADVAATPSKTVQALQKRVSKVLGPAAAAVDTTSARKVEVAAAAFELLALRITELQVQAELAGDQVKQATLAAADRAQQAVHVVQQAYEEQLEELQHSLKVEHVGRTEAESRCTALQKELSRALLECSAAGDAARGLEHRLELVQANLGRLQVEHQQERVEWQAAEKSAHACGFEAGQLSVQAELQQVRACLEACEQQVAGQHSRITELQDEIALRDEQHAMEVQEVKAQAAAQQAALLEALREASDAVAAREADWRQREALLREEHKHSMERLSKECAAQVAQEQERCHLLLDEEHRAGLARLDEAASQWEQQRQQLEAELEAGLQGHCDRAAAEAVREARRAMEQEYMARDAEVRRLHESALSQLRQEADQQCQGLGNRETELLHKVDVLEGQLRSVKRELSEVNSSVALLQAANTQLTRQRDEALETLESKVQEYKKRLADLETFQDALRQRQQGQGLEREATVVRLQQRLSAITRERDELQQEVTQLQVALAKQQEAASAAQEAGERAWQASQAATGALQEVEAQAAAREARLVAAHKEQVREMMASAAAQLSALRAKQEALGGALMDVMGNESLRVKAGLGRL